MKTLVYLTGLILLVFIYGFYLSQISTVVTPTDFKRENPPGLYDYRGVSNVHTNISIGSSSPLEVIADARQVGLDFLILTDVNKFSATENLSGYHGNLLVFDSGEFTYLDSRLQIISSEKTDYIQSSQDAHLFFTDLLSQKSSSQSQQILVLAHPYQNGLTWSGELPVGLHGLEIVNPKSISDKAWKKSKINVVWSLLTYPFNPQYAFLRLFQEPSEELALWDKMNERSKVVGFSGADASARAIPYANYLLKFPSYQRSLEITSNHVLLESELTGSYKQDRQKLFSALHQGQFYIALDLLGDPKGFNASIQDKDKTFLMGSRLKFSKGLKLSVHLPVRPNYRFETLIIKNGERDHSSEDDSFTYEIKSPGVYRVAVRVLVEFPLPDGKRWANWIYTNPFFIY